jgi:mono/diheme cytochrome c family protein
MRRARRSLASPAGLWQAESMAAAGRMRRLLVRGLVVFAVVELVRLAYPAVRGTVLSIEDTPAARGERLAVQLGCFGCHGPAGQGGIKNPKLVGVGEGARTLTVLGGEDDEVPAFTQQTQMMYVKTTDDIREYILDGAPRRKRDDPDYRAEIASAVLHMPAYRSLVTAAQVEDLVAYLRATSGQILPEDKKAARGGELALELSCFSCHGALGAGGMSNPGSFKGYVPAFWGEDFDELVRDDDELRRWIAEGKISRIAENPVGKVFFERQALKMPAYGKLLPPADVDALVAYVRWIRTGPWRPQLR